jgi:hypothetical protein
VLCEVADSKACQLANLPQLNLKTKEQYLFISRHFAKHFAVCQGGAKNREMKISSSEVFEARLHSPLILLFWIPQTLMVLATAYYDIRWSVFGNTKGITKWYTNNFKSIHEAYWWIAKDIGVIGCLLMLILAIGYLWMCRLLYIAFFYNER